MGRRPTFSSLLLTSLLAATLLLAISPAIPEVILPPGPPGELVRWLNAGTGEAEAAGSVVVQETPLTSGGDTKNSPDIYQDVAVFQQGNAATESLRVYAVRVGAPTPWALSPEGPRNQSFPRVYDNTAVWADKRPTPGVFRANIDPPSGSATRVASKNLASVSPAIFGDYIAYQDNGSPNVITVRRLSTGTIKTVPGSTVNNLPGYPALADGLLAVNEYNQVTSMHHASLFSFDLSMPSAFTHLFSSPVGSVSATLPQVTGSRTDWTLVWQQRVGDNYDIAGNRSSGGLFTIVSGPLVKQKPVISGNLVAWQENGGPSGYDIYGSLLGQAGPFPISTATGDQTDPRVNGDRVVWADNRSGTSEIYSARVQWLDSTPTPSPPVYHF